MGNFIGFLCVHGEVNSYGVCLDVVVEYSSVKCRASTLTMVPIAIPQMFGQKTNINDVYLAYETLRTG